MVKMFVYPIIDYVTFLQPLTPKDRLREIHLNIRVAEWVLETKIPQTKVSRAVALIGLKPLELRRAKAARRIAVKTISGSQDPHLKRCATILGVYGSLKNTFRGTQQQ